MSLRWSHTHPSPHRLPAVMAALMAAVSSVAPSPIIAIPGQSYLKLAPALICRLTGSAIVLHISEDRITRFCVRSETLVGDISHPVVSMHSKKKTGESQEQTGERTHGQLRASRRPRDRTEVPIRKTGMVSETNLGPNVSKHSTSLYTRTGRCQPQRGGG